MHALIIEDSDLIAIAIEEILSGCGFTSFDVAVSLDEAVTAAANRCPELITADVELRPGSGIDAVQTICVEKPIPVIFITGQPEAARLRMPTYLVLNKPFWGKDIEAAVRHVMAPLA